MSPSAIVFNGASDGRENHHPRQAARREGLLDLSDLLLGGDQCGDDGSVRHVPPRAVRHGYDDPWTGMHRIPSDIRPEQGLQEPAGSPDIGHHEMVVRDPLHTDRLRYWHVDLDRYSFGSADPGQTP